MHKNMFKGAALLLGLIGVIGCASGGSGVEVRRYIEVKDRLDQDMGQGNAGFLSGEPQPEDRSTIRKTRKTYVLEVSSGDPVEQDTVVVEEPDESMDDGYDSESRYDAYEEYETDNYIEVSGDEAAAYDGFDSLEDTKSLYNLPTPSATEYTVKKDDTLQKISKKFYDSYSKWPKIYEANKGVIPNPDRIKPGTVIQIPAE